jgi:nicotinate-nucleotide--dimethylbenzimidazole phosphoribosyltransferase
MSVDRWNTVLVLGGIRSGKSAFAESLVSDAPSVRYVATAVGAENDPEWVARIEAHQRRRPQSWSTEETGADPARLAAVLADAKPDDTLLVDDLGGWVAALLRPDRQPNDDEATVAELAEAVRTCAARLVLVSPEVGLSLVPTTPVGRAFADALGTANQSLAAVCDRVAFVVAGQPTWLKLSADLPAAGAAAHQATAPQASTAEAEVTATATRPAGATPTPAAATAETAAVDGAGPTGVGGAEVGLPPTPVEAGDKTAEDSRPAADVFSAPTMMLPLVSSGIVIQPGMELPLPDNDAGPDARDRLATLDLAGAGLGVLGEAIEFAAATQSTAVPRPWAAVRVLLVSGDHAGGAAAGGDPDLTLIHISEPTRRVVIAYAVIS